MGERVEQTSMSDIVVAADGSAHSEVLVHH